MLLRRGGTKLPKLSQMFLTTVEKISGISESRSAVAEGRKPFSINRLQFFPGLEPHRLARWNRNLCAGARIAADAGFSRAHVEHAESPQLNAVAVGQRLLHALKDGFHCQLGFSLGDAGSGYHFVDDVELDHKRLPGTASGQSFK